MLNVPLIGIVENMSYLECPDCKKIIKLFGESKIEEVAAEANIPVIARLPIDPLFAEFCDQGRVEEYKNVDISLKDM